MWATPGFPRLVLSEYELLKSPLPLHLRKFLCLNNMNSFHSYYWLLYLTASHTFSILGVAEPVVRKKIGFQAMSCMVFPVVAAWLPLVNILTRISVLLASPEVWEFLWQKWPFVITFFNFHGHCLQTYLYFISVISMFNNIVTPYPLLWYDLFIILIST
jgi:hypothetical protein